MLSLFRWPVSLLRLASDRFSAGAETSQLDFDQSFEQFQLHALALQAERVLMPLLAVNAAIAWLLPGSKDGLAGWLLWLVVALLLTSRWLYSKAYLRESMGSDLLVLRYRRMLLFNFAIGVATGAFCWLGFPAAGPLQHAAITTLLVGLAAGAVATCASSRWSFVAYALPMFLQLMLAWILFGQRSSPTGSEIVHADSHEGLHFVFASAIAALFWVLLATCNDSERWIRNAFKAGRANLDLVGQLKHINIELHQQRESALAANQAKTRFLAAASHDLRQPLHALSLYSASLSLQALSPRAKQLSNAVQDCIEKSLAPLLDALLDVSKLDANLVEPVPEVFSLDEALITVREELQARCDAKGLSLNWQIRKPAHVFSDLRLVVQIVRNLLDNALKYTHAGSVGLRVIEQDHSLYLEVSDTGIGIDSADLPRVFEEFYQCGNVERDRSKGLGLGLAIVKRLSDLLGLPLAVESQCGLGTVFRLTLAKAHAGLGERCKNRSESSPLARIEKRVLVIDNETMVRDSTKSLLEAWGCTVSVVATSFEAVKATLEHPFDILLSDYRLIGSENGLDLLRRLSEIQPGAHCCLVTGETASLPWERLQEQNITVLHKPLVPRVFLETIESL
jgi:signal transduction histidine kinase